MGPSGVSIFAPNYIFYAGEEVFSPQKSLSSTLVHIAQPQKLLPSAEIVEVYFSKIRPKVKQEQVRVKMSYNML